MTFGNEMRQTRSAADKEVEVCIIVEQKGGSMNYWDVDQRGTINYCKEA